MHRLRSLWRYVLTRVDALWGYDVFIAHRRKDAAVYAKSLHDALAAEGCSCFIDQTVYGPGDSLELATVRHVQKSTLFVLVASPELLIPRAPDDWVRNELRTYLASHTADPKVIVADVDGTVEMALATADIPAGSILPLVRPFVRIHSDDKTSRDAHLALVIDAVKRSLRGRRRDRSRLRVFQVITGVLGALLVSAVVLGMARERQRLSAESRRLVTEARSALVSPSATQSAVLAARAALWMSDTSDSRSAASDVLRWVAAPIGVFDTGREDGGIRFAAQRPTGELVFHSFMLPTSATAIMDRTGRIWTSRRTMPCDDLEYSPDGRRLACHEGARAVVWDVPTGSKLLDANVATDEKSDVMMALNEDGSALAVADGSGLTLFDVDAGTSARAPLPGQGWPPLALAVSPDGRHVAATPSSTTIGQRTPTHVLDVRTRQWKLVAQQLATTSVLAFSRAGTHLAIGARNGRIDVYDLTASTISVQLNGPAAPTALSVSTHFLAAVAYGALAVFDIANGEQVARASTDGPIYHVRLNEAAGQVLTAGAKSDARSGRIVIWDLEDALGFRVAQYVPDDGVLTAGFSSEERLLLLTHKVLRTINLETSEVVDTEAFFMNIDEIMTADSVHRALFLGQEIGAMTSVIRDLAGRDIGPAVDANASAVTPDARTVVLLLSVFDSGKSRLTVWRAASDATTTVAVPDFPKLIGIDSRGRYVVLSFRATPNGPARLAAYSAGDLRQLASADRSTVDVVGSVDPRGEVVAIGDGNTLTLLSLPALAFRRSLRLTGVIQVVDFSPTGSHLAVIDTSGTMTLLDRAGSIMMTARTPIETTQRQPLAFSPRGDILAVVGQVTGKSTLHLLPIGADNFERELCRRLIDRPSAETWRTVLPDDEPPHCPAAPQVLGPAPGSDYDVRPSKQSHFRTQ
jgi:hypothetical protein